MTKLPLKLAICLVSGAVLAACGGQDSNTNNAQLLASASATKIIIPAANVTASSVDTTNVPGNAVDNNLSTHWTGGAASGTQWIQFNLGGCYMVDYAKLAWFNGDTRKYNYTLKASGDNGVTWTTVMTGNSDGTTSGRTVYDFPDTSANVIRLESTGNNTSTKVSLSEAEVWSVGAGTCGSAGTTTTTTSSTANTPTTAPPSTTTTSSTTTTTTNSGGIAAPPDAAPTHDTSKAPGKNFNLSTWKMTTGSGTDCDPGLRPAALAAGATAPHFLTNTTDGSMSLTASSADCMTSNTSHPRTEFRELWKGDPDPSGSKDTSSGWTIAGTHILDVWMSATGSNMIVGQIHPISGGSNLPLLKCYYTGSGMSCTMEKSLTSSGTASTLSFSGLTQGKPFFYRISYTNKKVCVSVGANPTTALSGTKCATPDSSFLSSGLLNYFKAGNYNQGSGSPSVKIYYMNTYHAP